MSKTKPTNKSYSLKKILINDYISFLAWLFPVIIFGMSIFIKIFGFLPDLKRGRPPLGVEAIPFFIQFGLIALVVGIVVLAMRVSTIKNYFDKGVEVNGKVTKILVWRRDRGRIYFTFQYRDLEGDSSVVVHFNKMTRTFLPHKPIKVLVKPEDPTKAIIKDIFQ
jgi:hypothetical protein